MRFDHQGRELRFEVVDATSVRNWGRMATLDYFGRNATPTGFFASGFESELQKGRNGRILEILMAPT